MYIARSKHALKIEVESKAKRDEPNIEKISTSKILGMMTGNLQIGTFGVTIFVIFTPIKLSIT